MKRYILNDSLLIQHILWSTLTFSFLALYLFTGTPPGVIVKEYGEQIQHYREYLSYGMFISIFFWLRVIFKIIKFTKETEKDLEEYINKIKNG